MSVKADDVVLLTLPPPGDELVPVDAGGDGHAGPDAAGERDPGLEPAAVVEDLGPLARRSSRAFAASSADSSIVGIAGRGAMAGRVGERRVEELRAGAG